MNPTTARADHNSSSDGLGAPVLVAKGLRKTYLGAEPAVEVLKGVNLVVRAGEFVAVMGSSGSGKSTLLYCVSGMDRPTCGTVEFLGKDMTNLDDQAMSHMRLRDMGFVFQQPYFLENLSVRDNILLPAVKSARYQGSEAEARVDQLLGRFGIDHVGSHGVTHVSGGQLQRAAICRALVNSPAVLFADEPTGALNHTMSVEVLDVLHGVHTAGTSIVMVTHDPASAARADRVVYLRDGQIVDEHVMGVWSAGDAEPDRNRVLLDWLRAYDF